MSEKVTFRELIESIAEETDNTEQFTHDFLKDFVDVINGGLQQNDTVNIAGFGKFELRKMEEREGYNPQTEEKITIPAHNKVVFKPYKDVRELVNAPYAHLEPELIEEEDLSAKEDEDIPAPKASETDEEQAENIETGQDTTTLEEEDEATPQESVEESVTQDTSPADDTPADQPDDAAEKTSENDENEIEQDQDPFGFDHDNNDDAEDSAPNSLLQEIADEGGDEADDIAEEPIDDSSAEEDDDVVEFQGNTAEDESEEGAQDPEKEEEKDDEEAPRWLNAMIGPEASEKVQPVDEEEEHILEEQEKESDAAYMPGGESSEDEKEDGQTEEQPKTAAPQLNRNMRNRNSGSSFGIWVAAAVILLMLAGGVLYFSLFSDTDQTSSNTQKIASTATVQPNNDNQQQEQSADQQKATKSENKADSQTSEKNQQATSQQTQQSTQQSSAQQPSKNKSSASKTAASGKKEDHSIKKGQTLWSIAEDKYGNPRLWPWIYGKNNVLTNPHTIETGRSLTVPLPSGPQNMLSQPDSVGVAKGFLSTYQWYRNNEPSKAKNHLWAAMRYHQNIRDIATIQIDQADLSYANSAR